MSIMKIFTSHTFSWKEVGFLKLGLISTGIILAKFFGEFLFGFMWLWWAIFAIFTAYFAVKFLKS